MGVLFGRRDFIRGRKRGTFLNRGTIKGGTLITLGWGHRTKFQTSAVGIVAGGQDMIHLAS